MSTGYGYLRTFPATPDQVSKVRDGIGVYLNESPAAEDVILIASEFASNSVQHSLSRWTSVFTVRCQTYLDGVWIEVEDEGGAWLDFDDGDDLPHLAPHGLEIVGMIAGPANWGIHSAKDGPRVAWARVRSAR